MRPRDLPLVNKNRKETGIRCSGESTGGPMYKLNALRAVFSLHPEPVAIAALPTQRK